MRGHGHLLLSERMNEWMNELKMLMGQKGSCQEAWKEKVTQVSRCKWCQLTTWFLATNQDDINWAVTPFRCNIINWVFMSGNTLHAQTNENKAQTCFCKKPNRKLQINISLVAGGFSNWSELDKPLSDMSKDVSLSQSTSLYQTKIFSFPPRNFDLHLKLR